MALNLSRWWKYAQAKANSALRDAERELDDLEAERAAQVAERPWLADDAEAPSLDTARARIEWEAAQQAGSTGGAPTAPAEPSSEARPHATGASEPEVEAARLELDRREREAKARLEAMRDELGIDPPA